MSPPSDHDLQQAVETLKHAQRIAALTGAGVSAESGVPTFRGSDGLWEGHSLEEVATPGGFSRNPELVWRFYNERRAKLWRVKPNPGHAALAKLEHRWGSDRFTLCTQNVDGLHRAAGSQNVLELHGNLVRVRCTTCAYKMERQGENLEALPKCPDCEALLRPDIVWFHEMLPEDVWQRAGAAAGSCDCFLVVGTSAVVYPAAGLVEVAQRTGATIIEINPDVTAATATADVSLRGKSGEVLPLIVEQLEREQQ